MYGPLGKGVIGFKIILTVLGEKGVGSVLDLSFLSFIGVLGKGIIGVKIILSVLGVSSVLDVNEFWVFSMMLSVKALKLN